MKHQSPRSAKHEAKTQHLGDQPRIPETLEQQNLRIMSGRLANLERGQIDFLRRMDAILIQVINEHKHANELDHDLALDTLDRLDKIILASERKREELTKQKAQAKTITDFMLLDMQDDLLVQRLDRTRAERERASKIIDKTGQVIGESQVKIKKIKEKQVAEQSQGLPFLSAAWFREKVFADAVKWFSLAIIYAAVQLGLVPFVQKVLLPILIKAFGGT